MLKDAVYQADIYLRLSKEDGDKEVSDSIANQQGLILDFVESMPDICIHKIRIDDGYSGIDFNRPAFVEMLEAIKAGYVNCVIVKDFSRLGRDYIETGRYIQVLFPRAGVRFIAVSDAYDSAKERGYMDNIIVPFKNMINDAYCADISTKVRSHLEVKRKRGDFVGAFAVYGYMKSKANRNKLIVDDFAADVVRDIFIWKLHGMSALGIAQRLNREGVLSPMEYKRYLGLRYATPFKLHAFAKWQAKAVLRILSNEVYAGVLEQGKRTTRSYKSRKCIDVPQAGWTRVGGAHEAIIERPLFDTVQGLLRQDTRAVVVGGGVRPLCGLIFCGDCGAVMVHKTNTRGERRYGYYVCSGHRLNKEVCRAHTISSVACEATVLTVLKMHIATVLDTEKTDRKVAGGAYNQRNIYKLSTRLEAKQEELRRSNALGLSLHESYQDGLISLEDFESYKAHYHTKIQESEAAILTLKKEIEAATIAGNLPSEPDQDLEMHINAQVLTRKMAVAFLESVSVWEGGRLTIVLRYQDVLEGDIDGTCK